MFYCLLNVIRYLQFQLLNKIPSFLCVETLSERRTRRKGDMGIEEQQQNKTHSH